MNTPGLHDQLPIADLQSSNKKIAQEAHQQILKMGPSVLPQLIAILTDDSAALEFRSRIAMVLGEMQDQSVLQSLIDTLLSVGAKNDMGLGLFSGLGVWKVTVMSEAEYAEKRKAGLASTPSPNMRPVKANFINALGYYKQPQAVEALTSVLRQGDYDSQIFALSALRNIGTSEAVRAMITVVDYPAKLDPSLTDSPNPLFNNYSNISQLAYNLDKLGAAAAPALDLIIEALRKPINGKFYLIKIVGDLGGAQACDVLFELLHEPDRDIRFEAAKTLAKLHDRRAIAPLLTYLADSDPKIRGYAVTSLGNFKDDEVVDALIPLLPDAETAYWNPYGKHEVTTVGKFALDTLKKIATTRALEAVTDWEVKNKNANP